MNSPHPSSAYKILTADQWAAFQADGEFAGAPVDLTDGYIHLSSAEQTAGTLTKHFTDDNGVLQTGLVIAKIDLTMLGDDVRWEISRGGELFPHVYNQALPIKAVLEIKRP